MADISATMVKQLRDRTGAGMMDCKNALVETGGDEEKALEIIQKKGLAKVAKKAGAIATEGAIHSYIHAGARIGVLVEVNCQTDFVARGPDFKGFVEDVCLQIASMSPLFTRREDVPPEAIEKQKALYKGQMDEEDQKSGKKRPEQAIGKILDGKLAKWLSESCLVEQVSVRDNDKSIQQISDELSAKIGEKISVRRFVRFELGEGVEKQKKDLAAEVAETLKGS